MIHLKKKKPASSMHVDSSTADKDDGLAVLLGAITLKPSGGASTTDRPYVALSSTESAVKVRAIKTRAIAAPSTPPTPLVRGPAPAPAAAPAAALPAALPTLSPRWQVQCRFGGWSRYQPDPKMVLVIGHGFNGNIERLQQLGYTVECIYLRDYDRYPLDHATQPGRTPGRKAWLDRPIDAPTKGVKDLATLVDDVVLRRIRQLVSAGHGPSAVVTGSRGGQVTISRLWKGWCGPSVVLNGGCEPVDLEPHTEVTLGVLCGSTHDWTFHRQRWLDWKGTVVHYDHPDNTHAIESYNDAIGPLLRCVITNAQHAITQAGAGLGSATVAVKPSAAVRAFVRIR